VSAEALGAGLREWDRSFNTAILEHPADKWRTAGRKTKADPNGEDIAWWQRNGPVMVAQYHAWRRQNPNLVIWETPQGAPAIELQVNIQLEDGTMLKGYIDRVFQDFDSGELLIVDLKSGKTTPPPIQLATYALAIEKTFGFAPRYGSYWMAREGTLDATHDLSRFPPAMVSRWFRDVNKALSMDIYVPHVTRDCSWCSVKDSCYTQVDNAYRPDFNNDLNSTLEG